MSRKNYQGLAVALVLLGVLATGCRKKESDESPFAVTALPSAVRQMAPEAPYVLIAGNTVLLDGASSTRRASWRIAGRMQKLDELHDALKARREARRAAKPSSPFAAQVIVECPTEIAGAGVQVGVPHDCLRRLSP